MSPLPGVGVGGVGGGGHGVGIGGGTPLPLGGGGVANGAASLGVSTDAGVPVLRFHGFGEMGKRAWLNCTFADMMSERACFEGTWRDIADFIRPTRGRFLNSGRVKNRRNKKILDTTATDGSEALQSGIMVWFTSPSRPWFVLRTPYPELNEVADIKRWLADITNEMHTLFARSNTYEALPTLYGDEADFGTSAMHMSEDEKTLVRFSVYPVGSYLIAQDAAGRVNMFGREYQMTVMQVIQRWCLRPDGSVDTSKLSESTRLLFEKRLFQTPVNLRTLIYPNMDRDPEALDPLRSRPWIETTWEYPTAAVAGRSGAGAPQQHSVDDETYVNEAGYHEFPVLVARWSVAPEDVWATACPGMKVIELVASLQSMERRTMTVLDKITDPPLQGPAELRGKRVSLLAGDVTLTSDTSERNVVKPIHEIRFSFQDLEFEKESIRRRIRRAYFEDLLRMMMNDGRGQPPTAEEIRARQQEKFLFGPVLERHNQDLHDPMVDRMFGIMERRGYFRPDGPFPVPSPLAGVPLIVQYTSLMAQAQRAGASAGIGQFLGAVGQMATFQPNVLDKVDFDQTVDELSDVFAVPPRIVRSDDDALEIREAREKAAAAQAAAQQAAVAAKAAKDLSETRMQPGTLLNEMAAGGGISAMGE